MGDKGKKDKEKARKQKIVKQEDSAKKSAGKRSDKIPVAESVVTFIQAGSSWGWIVG